MTEFEQGTSVVGSNHSSNGATTSANIICPIFDEGRYLLFLAIAKIEFGYLKCEF